MDYFSVAVVILVILAMVDLSVGVSNDAVNFLNSAIGSRVTSRRTILMVATAGILIGALFSSGIMEVARKGVFNPEMFTFADIMVVFLAVMLADVLLLDLFNTFGLPTSTTVSIVFELLGAASAVALFHTLNTTEPSAFMEYINARSALMIISGILLSVVVAFITGAMVQFFSRLLFTYEDSRHGTFVLLGWSALALTIISYFLFIKGLKSASFIDATTVLWVSEHTAVVLPLTFAGWLAVTSLIRLSGYNPLAFVVLAGTFALAMAFASNDLVNFIGVPLAGLESWQAWAASGLGPEQMYMDVLNQPVKSSPWYLFVAGVVMAATLWISARARSVTQTEVSLARQGDGTERFSPGPLSRGLVWVFIRCSVITQNFVPDSLQTKIGDRFRFPGGRDINAGMNTEFRAFDLVRASVNLAVASILIAIATSLKLPLSTTFVSFMVAMGTSLADQAWGRDTAVYRVAGVLSVLGGWFLTAAAAFFMAGVFACLLKLFGGAALLVLLLLIPIALYRSAIYHQKNSATPREAPGTV